MDLASLTVEQRLAFLLGQKDVHIAQQEVVIEQLKAKLAALEPKADTADAPSPLKAVRAK